LKISANIIVIFILSAIVVNDLLIAKEVIYSHRSYMAPFIDLPATCHSMFRNEVIAINQSVTFYNAKRAHSGTNID